MRPAQEAVHTGWLQLCGGLGCAESVPGPPELFGVHTCPSCWPFPHLRAPWSLHTEGLGEALLVTLGAFVGASVVPTGSGPVSMGKSPGLLGKQPQVQEPWGR